MKILSLRFKNLNSLYGEWAIDFTAPEFVSNGIFAIIGQTGAGKSTILDAICLALYGATPRLGKISGDVNNLMSRHTVECSSEVVFATTGGTYVASWSQRRARNSVDGKLQDYQHEIAFESGELIENKRSLINEKVAEITGMDFERFTKSMLLAQGGFDTFLKAPTEDKSKILEQITGTEIYSRISKQIFETAKHENAKLDNLNAETQGVEILPPQEEANLGTQIAGLEKEKQQLETQIKTQREIKDWFIRIGNLQKEKANAETELKDIEIKKQNFAPQMQLLEQANLAQEFEGEFIGLNTLRTNFTQNKAQSLDLTEKIANLTKLELSLRTQSEAAKETLAKAEQYQIITDPKINKTIEIDATISHQEQSLKQLQNNLAVIEKDRNGILIDKNNLEVLIAKQSKDFEELSYYLNAHSGDAKIGEYLISLDAKIKTIKMSQAKIEEQKNSLTKLEATIAQEKINLETQKQLYAKCLDEEQEIKNKIANYSGQMFVFLDGKTRKEIELEKELVTARKFNAQIGATLEQYRAKLEDGEPCVLCGALEHPYAHGNLPEADEFDGEIKFLSTLLEKIDEIDGELKKLNDKRATSAMSLQKIDTEITLKTAIISGFEKSISQLIVEINQEEISMKMHQGEFSEILVGFDIAADENAIEKLQERFSVFEETQNKLNTCQIDLNSAKIRLEALSTGFENQNQRFETEQSNLSGLSAKLDELKLQRKEVFGDKNPIIERQNINQSLEYAREENAKSIAQLNETTLKIAHYKEEVQRLNEIIINDEDKLKQAENGFIIALECKGFKNEQEYKSAILDKSQRNELAKYSRELEDIEIKTQTLLQNANAKLETETTLVLSDETQIDAEQKLNLLETDFMAIAEQIVTIKAQLAANEKARLSLIDKYAAIEKQKIECAKWQRLNILIGSADGKKFRNFAQGLTFDIMVAHANQQLMKMSERYLLARDINDKNRPLELNVIDNFQAGQSRPVKNLSGGESFLISLALALGLSQMASSKVRVDSLFLDEGFGTLDEDSLETALETLSRLHQDGKLIGVISHVSALKEKITTQINVTPISGGRSKLSGAGIL